MAVNYRNGKRAVTHYRVLERFGDYTYIECRLETGRTHQIRVHMSHIGHPLLGMRFTGRQNVPFDSRGSVCTPWFWDSFIRSPGNIWSLLHHFRSILSNYYENYEILVYFSVKIMYNKR